MPEKAHLCIGFDAAEPWQLTQLDKVTGQALALAKITQADSFLEFSSRYQDFELKILLLLFEKAFILCTEGNNAVIFSYLPYPELLLLADRLGCFCYTAEPSQSRCTKIIEAWEKKGGEVEEIG